VSRIFPEFSEFFPNFFQAPFHFILDLAIQAFVGLFIKGKNLQAIYTTSGYQ
jgi:hypothetical protein